MNETDAGASVTGWILPDAPKTRPASRLINSSRLSSGSGCCASAAGEDASRRMSARAEALLWGFTCSTSTHLLSGGFGPVVDVRSKNEQLRAELKPGALRDLDVE